MRRKELYSPCTLLKSSYELIHVQLLATDLGTETRLEASPHVIHPLLGLSRDPRRNCDLPISAHSSRTPSSLLTVQAFPSGNSKQVPLLLLH